MGHLLFLLLHTVALLTGAVWLFITIPLHIVYSAVGRRNAPAPGPESQASPRTHVKCPDCRELVQKDARVCKHCGCKLVPQK